MYDVGRTVSESVFHDNLFNILMAKSRGVPTVYDNLKMYGAMAFAHPLKMAEAVEFYREIDNMIWRTRNEGVESGALIYYSGTKKPHFVLGEVVRGDETQVSIPVDEPPKRGYYLLGYVHTHPSMYGCTVEPRDGYESVTCYYPVPSHSDVLYALETGSLLFGVGVNYKPVDGGMIRVVAWYYVNPDAIRDYRRGMVRLEWGSVAYEDTTNSLHDFILGGFLVHSFFRTSYIYIYPYKYDDFGMTETSYMKSPVILLEAARGAVRPRSVA